MAKTSAKIREEEKIREAKTDHDILLDKVLEAKQITSNIFWKEGFLTRRENVDSAYGTLQLYCKQSSTHLTKEDDLLPYSKIITKIKDRLIDFDRYTKDMSKAVVDLNYFVNTTPLLIKENPQKALWNPKDGTITIITNTQTAKA